MPSTQMSCDYDAIYHNQKTTQQPNICQTQAVKSSDNPSESSSFTAPARPNLTFFGSKPPCKTCLFPRHVTTSTIISQLPIGNPQYKPTPPSEADLPPKEIFSGTQTQTQPSIDHRTPILRYGVHTPKPERSQRYEHQ
jgi:hypothetical protein